MEARTPLSYKLVCHICLSVDNHLTELQNEKDLEFYMNALNEIPMAKPPGESPQICPNCCVTLNKSRLFKDQVISSYKILQACNNETDLDSHCSEIKAPIEEVDINDESMEVKHEMAIEWTENEVMIKQCKDEDSNDGIFFDDLPLSYAKEMGKKKKKKRKKKESLLEDYKVKSKKKSKLDDKITIIHLTYEEMMLEREDDMRRETYASAEFKCEGCVVGFSAKEAYDKHMESKHSEKRGSYKCPICKTTHANVEAFTIHYRRHTRRYSCGWCGARAAGAGAARAHAARAHARHYTCRYCGKIFNSPNSHRYHLDTHKGRLQCKLCDKTFIHRSALKNHKTSVHELNNKFPCHVCSKVFRWKTSLTRHVLSHHTQNKNTAVAYCELCNVSFTMISNYQRHLNTSLKHVSKDQLRFICEHCGRRFSNKTKVREHILDQHLRGAAPAACAVCHKVSKNRGALAQHVRNVHRARVRDKICHHCGKGFPTKSQLESHIRMHTGERPFFCQYCNSSFSQQSNLYKHNRQVHMNVKAKKYTASTKKMAEEKPLEPSIDPATYPVGAGVALTFQYTSELNENEYFTAKS